MVWCELHNKWDKLLNRVSGGYFPYNPVKSVSVNMVTSDIITIFVFPLTFVVFYIVGHLFLIEHVSPKKVQNFLNKRFYCSVKNKGK